MRPAFLSVAPPTPNGNLHLGHLSGPYIACDVYRRYLALRGVPVVLVSGSDDHQSYVAAKGLKMGMPPERVATCFGDAIYSTLRNVGVKFDYFLRPTKNPEYIAFVQSFFQKLVASGHVVEREADVFYCDPCQRYLFEAYLGGNCPHCDGETNAQGCEECGFYNDGTDLKRPECNQCLKPPSVRRIKKFFFSLEPHHERLARFHSHTKMSPFLREFTDKLLSKSLPDVSASFPSDWGIPVPIPGCENQVIYEWLEMAAGYLFMAEKLESKIGGPAFHGDSSVEIAQFFGFDNSFFYTTFIPALLLANDPNSRLPEAFLSNRYYQLEGLKFSTSQNHAVWGDELLEVASSDVVRFGLLYNRPETGHSNFSLTALCEIVESELSESWEAWLNSLSRRMRDSTNGASSQLPSLQSFRLEMESHYSTARFSLSGACQTLCRLVEFSRRLDSVPGEIMAAQTLSILACPILPDFSRSLWRALRGESEMTWEACGSPPNGTLNSPLVQGEFSRAAKALKKFEEGYAAKRRKV
jgi:methionyl-tRNA synthetase